MKLTFSEIIQKHLAKFLTGLPSGVIKWLAGKPIEIDGNTMDPHIQFMVKFFASKPEREPDPVEKRRVIDVQGDWLTHPPHPDVQIRSLGDYRARQQCDSR